MKAFRLIFGLALAALTAGLATAQSSSVAGTITDPTGAVIPGVEITLENTGTGSVRNAKSDNEGRYSFPQVAPGDYKITGKSQGFNDVVINQVRLLVNQPATVNVVFEKVGQVVTTIAVEASGTQVNTVDASLGNAMGEKPILQLPFEGRNVVGLLAIQPGVTFIQEPDPASVNDYRSGSVNGGKSDQANVTLDGVDVNDQQNRSAFTSVLRVSLDSVQEFRTTTTNAGADQGRSSGAQVSLVTRSGTNQLRGSVYEYHRNTLTSSNDYLSNASGVGRQKLIRNVFGAALGGPIKKNRVFLFGNYEGRKDRSDGQALRTVPTAAFRQGIFTYTRRDGTIGQLTPAEIRAQDPGGIGPNAAVLSLFQSYPLPNDTSVGDQLNTSGYRFNAPRPLNWNTYISKLDVSLDSASKHMMFVRGQYQDDKFANGLPQFPGEPASQEFIENSKGIALGYTGLLRSNLVATTRWGLTRQGLEVTGLQTAPDATFRDLSNRFALTRVSKRATPVYQFSQDFAWTKGAHNVSVGGVIRWVRNQRLSNGSAFSFIYSNSSWLQGTGSNYVVPDARDSQAYRRQFNNILGVMSQKSRRANYDLQGNVLAEGALIARKFATEEYESYIQDTWRISRGLTLTAGVRYSHLPAIYEANGFQTSANIPLGDWFNQRGGLADQGKSQVGAGQITYNLASSAAGRPLWNTFNNWQPRVALAYSPQGSNGLSRFLFGGPGKTSIRAGFGQYYDIIGQGLITDRDATSLGFSTRLDNPANVNANPNAAVNPGYRFTGFYSVPTAILPAAPKGGFPQTQPDIFQITTGVDDTLKAPYTMNYNLSIGRDLGNGWFVQGSYVSRLSRRSLINDDLAMPTNLKDPASGQTYLEAATQTVRLAQAKTPIASVPRIAFWENMWPGAAGGGLTATQNIYDLFSAFTDGDYTTTLTYLDLDCDPACSKLGPNAIFNSQYSSLAALRSRGHGNYHSMQWSVRKAFTQGYQFDLNYTWSKSTDLGSTREFTGNSGQIRNSWRPGDMKSVSDYDQTHIVSMQSVVELPFGKRKKYLNNMPRLGEILVGGWQLTGIWRQTSSFVSSVLNDSGWPTNWNFFSWANQIGDPGLRGSFKDAPAPSGGRAGANIFANPTQAVAAYGLTLPGETGQRNGIRGDGLFTIDAGMGKRFELFSVRDRVHSVQIRAEAFNITNTTRFDVQSASMGIATPSVFGRYQSVLVRPRVFQFAARYEF